MKRSVIISPYQYGYFSGVEHVFNEFVPTVNLKRIFFSTMIQGGIQEFLLQDDQNKVNFLSNHIKQFSSEHYEEVGRVLNDLFRYFLPEGYENDKKYKEVVLYKQYLYELISSMKMNKSFVLMSESPKLEYIKNLIPPDLFIPIENLVCRFESDTPQLPLPSQSIPHKDISIFYDLINSELFSEYAQNHNELENTNSSITKLVESGSNFYKKYIEYLELKKLSISLLEISPNLIDTFFGKIPGHIADFFARLFTDQLNLQKRVIVYHFHPTIKYLINEELLKKIEK